MKEKEKPKDTQACKENQRTNSTSARKNSHGGLVGSPAGDGGQEGPLSPPAFLVVKYIIRFFFFPERLPHSVPGCREVSTGE